MRVFRDGVQAWLAVGFTLSLQACSAAARTTGSGDQEPAPSSSGGSGASASTGKGGTSQGPDLGGIDTTAAGTSTGVSSGGQCAVAQAEATLTKEPVDIILVLDNSGSMAQELQAVEDNINVNFASILATSDVDYRVILLSRHRKDVRGDAGESSTSICVSSPLSGLATCPAPAPVNSARFFHYNEKIESHDSLENILLFYNRADTRSGLTKVGYHEWLRVGAKKVFLELTDDDEGGPDDAQPYTVDSFFAALVKLDPAQFGTDATKPNIVWHSIIGLAEKPTPSDAYQPTEAVQPGKCTGNADKISSAGAVYQEMSRRTGGLRFPLCQFGAYDVVFHRIAEDVVTKAQVACDFALPEAPPMQTLELDKIAVSYGTAQGTPAQLKQAKTSADCQADAFYIENSRVYLCSEACDAVKATVGAAVQVLFTCESQIIVK
jgi:hypothetical protein